jgi:hypothetical protein
MALSAQSLSTAETDNHNQHDFVCLTFQHFFILNQINGFIVYKAKYLIKLSFSLSSGRGVKIIF